MRCQSLRVWAGAILAAVSGMIAVASAGEDGSGAMRGKIFSADAMTAARLGARCVFFGGQLTGKLEPSTYDGVGACSVWRTEGTAGKGNWSALGVQFANPRRAVPIGFRLEAAFSRPVTVNIESRVNDKPEKGFWITKWVGRKTFPLEAGRQTIEKTWAELNTPAEQWSAVNAVTLSVGEPVEVHLLGFELVYPADAAGDAASAVNWFDAGQNAVNPVARPFDKLSSVFGTQAGGARKSVLNVGPHPETGATRAFWGVEGDPAEKGWAVYGFGFADPVRPAPAGLRFEVFLTAPADLAIQPVTGFNANRTKGFYSAKNAGKPKTVALAPGRRTIEFLWSDFGIDAPADTNGVKFSRLPPGGKVFFERIDLVFADAATANQYRSVAERRLVELQRVLVDALAARGVDWKAALAPLPPGQVEPLVWVGMQASAQREQIAHFTALAAAAGVSAPELPALADRRDALVRLGASGDFVRLRDDVEMLQTELDAVVDRVLAATPRTKRRFAYDPGDRQFHYPDGRPFRMFGPHFFRSMFMPGLSEWRPWDLRYLSGLGFNSIRVQVRWAALEPERGMFEPKYLGIVTGILREAERYGFGVSIDLHWDYPAWFVKGAPGYEVTKTANKHNAYHWPEALVDTWERFGKVLAEYPNIVAFEVPTNETNLCASPNSFRDTPYLQKRWNDFLKAEYGTREALDAVWRAAGERYGLQPDERWDDASIAPLGFQGDADPQEAFLRNPRVYDHLRFAALMQTEVSGDIVKALRRSIPNAYGMFQRTIGDVWDKSPVPLDYHGVITCVGENVIVGTHYDMGSVTARKAATLSLASYDSEQQMEGNRRAVERHVALGLGFCPFAFHYRGGGGMLLADDDWHLKPEVGYLPLMADWVRNHVPPPATGRKIAVITNSRLEATTGRLVGNLPETLAARGYDVGVFDSLRVVAEPKLLSGYAFAVTTGNYLDPRLLDILQKFDGATLVFGRLDMDAHARSGAVGLSGELARRGLFLKDATPRMAGDLAGSLDLSGAWEFKAVPSGEEPKTPAAFERWDSVPVPGLWPEKELTGSLSYHVGDGWHRKAVTVPSGWKGRPLRFEAGGIDDIDWVFWNGKLIGHTGENVPNYWQAPRSYTIPPELVRYGSPNELVVCARNLRGNGGIHKGPVAIRAQARGTLAVGGGEVAASVSPATTLVTADRLAAGAELLVPFVTPDAPERFAALARQGRMHWYFKDTELDGNDPADAAILARFLEGDKR